MKKFIQWSIILLLLPLLAGCGNFGESSLSNHITNSSKTKKTMTTGPSKSGQYSTLLQDGKYHVSPIAGLTSSSDNENNNNLQAFETGLLAISKKEYSPDKYYFQEGKLISAPVAQKWLARKSANNPQGLNPTDNGEKDPNKRNPIYLQQLLEQDFYTQSEKNYKLSGVTIGLSLNDIDYYRKEQYGSTFETKITDSQRADHGKKMANEIIQRLRQQNNLTQVPITIGLYKQNVSDSLVGGSYFAYGVAKAGQKTITDWSTIHQQNQVLPVVGNEDPINTTDADNFSNFKNTIQNYFPNLSGVTAQTHYEDGTLSGMVITINTQFYGSAQICSFTQFVQDAANKYLPQQPAIEIRIQTVQQMQALLTKDYNNKQYNSHVFTSY